MEAEVPLLSVLFLYVMSISTCDVCGLFSRLSETSSPFTVEVRISLGAGECTEETSG